MAIVLFYAWINRNSVRDPGHLVMFDCQRYQTLEIMQDEALKADRKTITAAGGDPGPFRFANVGPPTTTVIDNRTGRRFSGHQSPILLKEETIQKCAEFQMARKWRGQTRFTHVYRVTVRVSDDELVNMRHRMALALAGGQYNLFREARVFDPTAGRCLLPLEVLASSRGIRELNGANALEYLQSFVRWNRTSCIGEDGGVLSDKNVLNRLFRMN